jgi:hypothetical protein
MTGGLLQIVAYGTNDLFLTGIPQITHFKIVYKKHTNFSMESVEIPLDGNPNFDNKSNTIIPKSGDLLSKLYLKVIIPQVSIQYDNSYYINTIDNLIVEKNKYEIMLNNYKEYFKYNFIFLNDLKLALKSLNFNWNMIYSVYLQYTNNSSTITKINSIQINFKNGNSIIEYGKLFSSEKKTNYLNNGVEDTIKLKNDINTFLFNIILYYKKKEKDLFIKIDELNSGIKELESNKKYFSWVNNLGFNIINNCSIIIGGKELCKMDSDYLYTYYKLNGNHNHIDHIDEMIGNISILTDYDNKIKPSYVLYIPIPCWFTQHNGSNIPLISMVYHDIEFNVEFNSLDKCCFFNSPDINLNNLIQLGSCSLLVDYIYLDIDEKTKFAQFSHEYLIQDIQQISSNSINTLDYSLELDFYDPVKDMVWLIKEPIVSNNYKLYNLYHALFVFQIINIIKYNSTHIKLEFSNNNYYNYFKKNSYINLKYTKYYDGKHKVVESDSNYIVISSNFIQYSNYYDNFYGIIYNESSDSTFNPINYQHIEFNGVERTTKNLDSNYFNYVIPYQNYEMCPKDGINVYTFSINPNEFQPSGTCNFSLLKSKKLLFNLLDVYYDYLINNNLYCEMKIYCRNYNVLRIHNGLTASVFS